MALHMRAVGRAAAVAAPRPASAVFRRARQSVSTRGGAGESAKASQSAQASAATAVRTHGGGVAWAYATRLPAPSMTATPHPVVTVAAVPANLREPSMAQTSPASHTSGG